MFKGYIPTKGKKPIEKVRGRAEFYSLEEVEGLQSYGGVLADNILMLDIDDSKESDILFKIVQDMKISCKVVQTTRGKHFYFKNHVINRNCIHKSICIGIMADIKIGEKNSVAPIKIDGKVRKVLLNPDHLDELPFFLYPIKKVIDLTELSEGDGRNQALFNYILTLQSEGLSKEAIKDIIHIINTHVLDTPLPAGEIETILRDESFLKQSFYNGAQLKHDIFSKFLQAEENIIKIEGILNIYDDGIYKSKLTDIESAMIKHIPILTKAKRAEVLAYLELICEDKKMVVDRGIVLKDYILNLDTMEYEKFNKNYVCKNKINYNYDDEAYNEIVDKTLNKIACNDPKLRLLLEELVGYCLFRRNELGKFFILTGTGSNGKSTFLHMIKNLIGVDNISSIALEELQQRFKTAELFGKLVNIGDDIAGNYIEDNSVLKKLVTGDTVNVERKGRDPFDLTNYSKLIFSANTIPRINDTSAGLTRRMVIVPFKAKFKSTDADFDPWIMDKLLSDSAMQYLLKIAIEGLKRVLENREFTKVDSVEQEIKEYELINNPVLAFLEEFEINRDSVDETYKIYSNWCIDGRLKPLSKIAFGKELVNQGYKKRRVRIKDERYYIYVKEVSENDS